MRRAFTLVELLVSVVILSVVILYALKLYDGSRKQILYISSLSTQTLSDSLFLLPNITKYNSDTKSAYDLLESKIKIERYESRQALREYKREINIPEPIFITPPPDQIGPKAIIDPLFLKDEHSSRYRFLKIIAF